MKAYTSEEWFERATELYEIIKHQMTSEGFDPEDEGYKNKLRTMVDFFSLWRGESFDGIRPHGLGDMQKKIYEMEGELYKLLGEKNIESGLRP